MHQDGNDHEMSSKPIDAIDQLMDRDMIAKAMENAKYQHQTLLSENPSLGYSKVSNGTTVYQLAEKILKR